ncbi:MAG: CARDB domain-containing protein [Nannocystaceae bacterium]
MASLATTGCPDDNPPGMTPTTTTDATSLGETFTDTSAGTTTESPDETTSGTTSIADDTGDTGELCETVLCGGACCEVEEECVNEACLPACPSEIRCGENQEICCDDGQVCLANSCATPTGPCTDAYDCAEGEFCEPTLDQCLPQPEILDCEIVPEFDDLDVQIEWSFETEQVISMPAVADIDGDMLPEVVINTYFGNGVTEFTAEIIVLDGTDGSEQFRIPNNPGADQFGSYSRSTVGIADVDDNGLADIVYVGYPTTGIAPFIGNSSRIHAINGLGQLLWSSHAPDGSPYYIYVRHGAPAFANFDNDDASEIVYGTAVLDNDGTVVFDQDYFIGSNNYRGGVFGSNGNYLGGISTIADLTGDGYPEIISGRQAWSVSWDDGVSPPDVQLTPLWEYTGPDGFPAVADLDLDGDPEVVVVGDPAGGTLDGIVYVLDGATGELWCGVDPTGAMCAGSPALRTQPISIPGGGRGGPPTIADFDGDGRPEIAVAGGSSYSVYDLNRMGEAIVQPAGDPPPADGAIYVRWTQATQDQSSNVTGSSVFDFQGDGISEVVYADECYLRVYSGDDGNVILEQENSSATIHELPIVADADGDGNSELVVVANDANADADCGSIPGYTTRRGVFVYGDVNDQWVRTRQVWNQHTYHVTNATSSGLVPPMLDNNWEDPQLNNFRQNFQGAGVFNAPDLEVNLSVGLANCLQKEFEVIATVRNTGSIGVPAGIDVSLYRGTDASGMLVSTQQTAVALLPGAQTNLSWLEPNPGNMPQDYYVEVDSDDMELQTECNEDNNTATAVSVACPDPG